MSLIMPGALPKTVFPLVGASPQGIAIASPGLEVRQLFALVALHGLLAGGAALADPTLIGVRAASMADATLAALDVRVNAGSTPRPPPESANAPA